ncbi:hypothetical protein EVB91_169 [Rhizobium phage RHph_I1_18]|nr:hypothetical protein EVB91_169 [Rhizobium phage RHph_I1_18]
MLVKELRKALKKMPGEMAVFLVSGEGVQSVKHIFRMNLVGVEQFCELRIFGGDEHTPEMEDSYIERYTGFKNREQLVEAYLKMCEKEPK